MNQIDIRKNIIDNFKNVSESEIRESIESSIIEKDELTLPGLGVFFEILWKNIDDDFKNKIINILQNNLK